MQERARLAGGWLRAGVGDTPDEWVVTAWLPTTAAVPTTATADTDSDTDTVLSEHVR